MSKHLKAWQVYVLCALLGALVIALVISTEMRRRRVEASFTVGDLHAVHAEVTVGKSPVHGRMRLADGAQVSTGSDGRARVRLDDGTVVVVAGATSFVLQGRKLELERGKLFVQGGPATRTQVTLGDAGTLVTSSSVAFERSGASRKVYCAQGELVVNAGSRQLRVQSGETATLGAQGVASVAPEKVFDDWTGGLAVPWAGETGQQSAIAELRGGAIELQAPLAVKSHDIDVRIEGEVAVTRTRTTYFNGSEQGMGADVRVAIPESALLSRVTRRDAAGTSFEAQLGVAKPAAASAPPASSARLEWAGAGWLRGRLPHVPAGATVELLLEYSEWLPTRDRRSTYRFPMAGEGEPPLIGELSARVDASGTGTRSLSASAGTSIEKRVVELRKIDVKPSGDLVVELAPAVVQPGAARAYVAAGPHGEDPFVMVRTEVPERTQPGVTLAVVLDTSMSVGSSALETERAVLDAILEGLGPRDALVVLAADQSVRPVGPAAPRAVDEALRLEVRKAAAALRPGGASNLGLALREAADALDAEALGERAGSGMVLYVGDGRPSMGEADAASLRRSLARRVGGLPRLGAVVVGPGADRWLLAGLVAGAGGVYEVADRSDAARAGAALLADALEPTLRDVELDLGPGIDRIYPREARALLAGSTVTVVGRLRGELPKRIGFRFRDGKRLVEESRPLSRLSVPPGADLGKRWAAARIEDVAARGDGLEAAIVLAHRYGLLTPWTSYFFDGQEPSSPFAWRVLELSPERDAAFATHIEGSLPASPTLLEPPHEFGGGASLKEAAEMAIVRTLQQAAGAIRACRDTRAAVRPEVSRELTIEVDVDADGRAVRVSVRALAGATSDAVLERCVQGVVRSLPYFASGAAVHVSHRVTLPESRGSRRTQCSTSSKLSLPLRKGVWRARAARGVEAYLQAARSCELPAWADRRALLLLLLEGADGPARLALARELDAAGESDAAAFVRKEALRRVTSFGELEKLSELIRSNEPVIDGVFDKAYRAAGSDEERLAVVRRFSLLAPSNALLRRRLLAVLEALGQKEQLLQEIEALRTDPFADAGLIAQAASALRRQGLDAEGRRTFGELLERAPNDPWTLAYVGDRLRAEGMFDEAVAAYESLSRIVPDEAAVSLRLALAHAGAGRLDVATRLLERVTQTGGRDDDGRMGELASITQAVLLAGARSQEQDPDVKAELVRRLLQTPLPDVASVVMVQAAPSDDPIRVLIARELGDSEEQALALDARALGLSATRVERGDGIARILLSRRADVGPTQPARAKVAALVLGSDRGASQIVTREVEVPADGKTVELRWNGETFL